MCTFQNKNPKYFFLSRQFSLSLSLLQFLATPLPQFFFYSLPFRQQHCHKSIGTFFFLLFRQFHCHNFFSSNFQPKSSFLHFRNLAATKKKKFPLIFGNFIATNQLPHFPPSNPLPKLLLNSSPRFRQLGFHNSYFLSPYSPTISTTWLPQWVSFQPLLLRVLHLAAGQEFQAAIISVISLPKFKFFLPPLITSFTFPLSYFLLEFRQRCCQNSLFFLNFSSNFEQYLYHK